MHQFFSEELEKLGFQQCVVKGREFILPPIGTIPAGTFFMGSDRKTDPKALKDELPQHELFLELFHMAIYPVTVAEYACAVSAGAVKAISNQKLHMRLTWEAQLNYPHYPVVGVRWKQALAYTKWLTRLTGEQWRLLTEAEWEKAARGNDKRLYPWGNEWDGSKARADPSDNYSEIARYLKSIGSVFDYPGGLVSIAAYPGDKSPFDVYGMAGNVSEWCGSLYKPYPYVPSDGREDSTAAGLAVLRGGNWLSPVYDVRVAKRIHDYRGLELSRIGFRLAR